MSLLDDVSIVVTPNGYKAGELYAVIPVPTEGAEEITNGDFSSGSTGWTFTNGSITDKYNASSTAYQSGIKITPFNKTGTYKVIFDLVVTSGSCKFDAGGGNDQIYTTSGTKEILIINPTKFEFNAFNLGWVGSLDNVSVKEWTGADMDVTRATDATRVDENGLVNYAEVIGGEELQDGDFALTGTQAESITGTYWTTGSKWIISNNSAYTDATSYSNLHQNSVFEVGKTYILSIEVSGGNCRVYLGTSATSFYVLTNGLNTITAVSEGDKLTFRPYTTPTTISNISVKEVTRDNVPRIDYTGGGCPHILAEPESTNLYKNYNLLSAIGAGAVSLNNSISPDGTQNATKLTFGSGLNDGALLSIGGSPCVASTVYTFSFYAKSVVGDGQFNLRIDTNSQSVLVGQGFTTTTDWVRYTHTFTSDAAATSFTSNSRFRKVTASNEILFYGMQLEKLSYSTSIIPTSGSTLTRNQDIFTRDGIGSLINSTEGTFFAEISKPIDTVDAYQLISLNNNTANSDRNSVTIGFTINTNKLFIRVKSSGSNVFQSSNQVSNADTFYKVAISYKSGASKIYVDGSSITPNSGNISGTFTFDAILDKLSFDYNGNNGLPFFGKVKQLQVYDTALTDDELELLTGAISYGSFNELAGADGYTII